MSVPTLPVVPAHSSHIPPSQHPPTPAPWLAMLAPAVALVTAGAVLSGVGDAAVVTAVANLAGAALGAALALVQGFTASDRRGRRRFVLGGLGLLAAAQGGLLLSIVFASGLLLGVGVIVLVSAATAWLRDLAASAPLGFGIALMSSTLGIVAGWVLPAVGLALLPLAAAGALVAPETVRGRRTPAFVVPTAPRFDSRPAALPVLTLFAAVLAVRGLGIVAGGALIILIASIAVTVVLVRAGRRGTRTQPLAESGRVYQRAVSVFDKSASPAPAAATTVRSVESVRLSIASARARGLQVGVHTTGHAAMGLGDLSGSALLRVAIDEPVMVDAHRGVVRIPAGRTWGEVVPVAARYGLAVPHGSSGLVGVVGYLSRGGLSAYGRQVGVAANAIQSVELVTADGRHLEADRDHESDLFWAVRGGGGGFGVVTAITVRAFVPGEVVTGTAVWEIADAPAVADAWAQWTAQAPSAITTSLRILTMPPLPGMPMRLTRRPMLVVDGTAVDGAVRARDAAENLLTRLRAAAEPVMNTWRVADATEVPYTHMDPPFSPPHSSEHALLGPAPAMDVAQAQGVVADFVAAATDGAVSIAELRQLGGALAEPPSDSGAVGHYRGAFAWLAIALHGKAGSAVADAAIAAQRSALSKWQSGFTVPTLAVERQRPARSFPDETARRVDAVRKRIDPDGVFRVDVAAGARSRLR